MCVCVHQASLSSRDRSSYIFIIARPTLPVSLVTEPSSTTSLKISAQAYEPGEGDIQLEIAEYRNRRFWRNFLLAQEYLEREAERELNQLTEDPGIHLQDIE